MAVSKDLIELSSLLAEEGFAFLAGELLSEFDRTGGEGERELGADLVRPAPPLALAAEYLRIRLAEPIRRLIEAERLANDIAASPGTPPEFALRDSELPLFATKDINDAISHRRESAPKLRVAFGSGRDQIVLPLGADLEADVQALEKVLASFSRRDV